MPAPPKLIARCGCGKLRIPNHGELQVDPDPQGQTADTRVALWRRGNIDESGFRLNSERIRRLFGNYHVAVLSQQPEYRVASLYSRHGTTDICRTLAVTVFHAPLPALLATADADIRQGASIGETLEAHDLPVCKGDDHWCCAPAGQYFAALTDGEVKSGTPLAVRVYTLAVQKHGELTAYAAIAEAYHPQHQPCSEELLPHCGVVKIASQQQAQALKLLLERLDQGSSS